uniref:(northern house mosquito) hypothetical protein n=2 Tax=Culex pipiens TaxID=7175 RepID=A0A8D8BP00_CULPI
MNMFELPSGPVFRKMIGFDANWRPFAVQNWPIWGIHGEVNCICWAPCCCSGLNSCAVGIVACETWTHCWPEAAAAAACCCVSVVTLCCWPAADMLVPIFWICTFWPAWLAAAADAASVSCFWTSGLNSSACD